ncbi:alpha-2-macroglobulin-like [Saccostrea echinata]|uniref:alpha-2-macroglobulin-like n=1 Tax=Saccostrea echinata TaxID=191078 RepID=UPI002A81C15B|nr:alpha-2-macroglobulin-like [Saccostrea echinata]
MYRLCWVCVLYFLNAVHSFPDFLFTVPASIYKGEEFDFCVSFPGSSFDGAVEVRVDMILGETETVNYPPQTYLSVSDAISCRKLRAPKQEGFWTCNVTMDGHGIYAHKLSPGFPSRDNHSVSYEQHVNVRSRRQDPDITLIQTDKPLYKPGQSVKFRIMRLKADNNLLPDTDKIKWVYIENPSNIRVMQWKQVPTSKGIASLEMLLSDDPPLGTWMIKAIYNDNKEYTNTFSVEEYVLPKYEVTITPPSYLLTTSPTIDAKVCAKYTYGKPVQGQLAVKICYKSTYYYFGMRSGVQFERPCTERLLEINGCTMVSVNSSEIYLNSKRFNIWGKLKINATVTEGGTGVTLHGESSGPRLTTESCKLEVTDDTDGFFKTMFPYRGKVIAKNPDGSPASNKSISIRASSYQLYLWRLGQNVTTNDQGEATFSIKDLPNNITTFSIEAIDADVTYKDDSLFHNLAPATAYKSVRRWYSPSDSYIQIEDNQQPLACGKDVHLDLLYSTPNDTNYNFYIMVMSRGRVIYTTNKRHMFSEEDAVLLTPSDPDQYLKIQQVLTTTPRPRRTRKPRPSPIPKFDNVTLSPQTPVTTERTTPIPILSRKRRNTKSCKDNSGKVFDNGSNFAPNISNPCWMCDCVNGAAKYCAMAMCDEPPCRNYKLIEGTCCGFTCPDYYYEDTGSCVDHSGKTINNGELFSTNRTDPCHMCTCENGVEANCNYIYCNAPPCEKYELVEGTCCGFICLDEENSGSCIDHSGNTVKNGDIFSPNRTDPCHMCTCENGVETNCNYIYCDAPPCEKYELVEGTCCGFICLDEETSEKLTCVDNLGNPVPDGSKFTDSLDPCLECSCNNGNVNCEYQMCKPLKCRNFQYVEGTCCEVICFDDIITKSSFIGRVQISIPITARFAPESRIIIYYIRSDGEVVSSSKTLQVEKCFDNKVKMDFLNKSVRPGSNATIRVSADPQSSCSIGVVDKSIDLLKAGHQMTKKKFYSLLTTESSHFHYYPRARDCNRNRKNTNINSFPELLRNPSDIPVDSYRTFQTFGLRVFTNLRLETRPCIDYIYPEVMYNRVEAVIDSEMPSAGNTANEKVRSFFPETWLWEIDLIGDSGENTLVRTIPDTITEWKGNAICLNTVSGLGISSVSSITAFQPFFLSFTLPYSAVRNEVVPVLVTIFNYLTECLVMRVTLVASKEFRVQSAAYMRTRILCVCGGESETLRYLITPLKIGKISIQTQAESIADDGTCGNSVVSREGSGVFDAVRRELLVDAEGIEQEYTYSSYLCPTGEPSLTLTEKIKLQVPTNRIQDSERGVVNVIGDVMGPALTNLKDLLMMPYGCGEQNMASFAPNIFVLQYFYNTNQDVSMILEDALRYMRVGYQRQLNYRHSDGSYSAFGEKDGTSGSTWLTAFVVKCLGQSKKYIDIDEADLNTSIAWFRLKQDELGCFPKVGYTHSYYLKGGWGKGNDSEGTLTAFVLIAMLEAGLPKSDPAVLGALRCLDLQEVTDTYMLSLMAYAYSLYDVRSSRRLEIMALLRSKLKRQGEDMVYWSRDDSKPNNENQNPWESFYRAPSAEVEMTSYALLAYTVGNQPEAVINAKPIVMWLSKQRNAQGGFSSTQDTIIALQALSVYGSLVHQGGIDISVDISGQKMSRAFSIKDENKLVLQTSPIPTIPNELTVTVKGVGCALVQANVKYNTPKAKAQSGFSVKVSTHRSKYVANSCAKRSIIICVSYNGASIQTKMAIVEVKMQTGWIPVRQTLDKILSSEIKSTIGLHRYEIKGNVVHFYFDYFDAHRRCFLFDVEQEIELRDPKPAYVKVYDYYETDSSRTVQYDMKTICGTKEELPFLTPEEYDSLIMDPDRNTFQIRVPLERIPGPPGIQSCPVCEDSLDTKAPNFTELVCKSARIFKVRTAKRDGVKYSMKLYADMKPSKKAYIGKFVNHKIHKPCSCSILEKKDKKFLIFDTADRYSESEKELRLTQSSTVVTWTKDFERMVFRKNKTC